MKLISAGTSRDLQSPQAQQAEKARKACDFESGTCAQQSTSGHIITCFRRAMIPEAAYSSSTIAPSISTPAYLRDAKHEPLALATHELHPLLINESFPLCLTFLQFSIEETRTTTLTQEICQSLGCDQRKILEAEYSVTIRSVPHHM